MIVYGDGTWECGADESTVPDGATVIPDGSIDAMQIQCAVNRQTTILAELDKLDLQAVRPLRAIAAGTANEQDHSILVDIETKAKELRKELSEIINAE